MITYLFSLTHPLFTSINDLTAFKDSNSNTQLYVTVDTFTKDETWTRTIELYTARPWGSVVHCTLDEQSKQLKCRTVATGFAFSNGIAISADQQLLYVVETTGRKLHVYRIDSDSALTLHTAIGTPFSLPDNIDITSDGSIVMAGHPSLLRFALHAHSTDKPKRAAPSQVIRIRVKDQQKKEYEIEQLYEAFDGRLSGSSVGIVHGQKLVVGSAMDNGVLICELNKKKREQIKD